MAFDLFGFTFGKKGTVPDQVDSFAPKTIEDGASVVEAGGFQGYYIDLDGTLKTDIELVRRYREMSLHSEVDTAIEDIINEAITEDATGEIVKLNIDKVNA